MEEDVRNLVEREHAQSVEVRNNPYHDGTPAVDHLMYALKEPANGSVMSLQMSWNIRRFRCLSIRIKQGRRDQEARFAVTGAPGEVRNRNARATEALSLSCTGENGEG